MRLARFGELIAIRRRHLPALACLLAALAGLWLGRGPLLAGLVRHQVLPRVQHELPGLTIRFASLRSNLVSRLELGELHLDYCPDPKRADGLHLTAPVARLDLPLTELLPWPGWAAVVARLHLELQGTRLVGSLAAASPAPAAATSTGPSLPTLPAPLTALPALSLTDTSLDLDLGQGLRLTAQGLDLRLATADRATEGQGARLTATELALDGGALPRLAGPLRAELRYRPGRLEVPALYFQEALVLDQGLLLASDQQGLHAELDLHLLHSQGRVEASLVGDEAKLTMHLADCDLTCVAQAAGETALAGHLQADADLRLRLGQPESLTGTLTAELRDGAWQGLALERLELAAAAGDQRLTLSKLELAAAGNRLLLREARLPLPTGLSTPDWRAMLAAGRAEANLKLVEPTALPAAWSALFLTDWQALGLTEASCDLTLAAGQLLVPRATIVGQAGQARLSEAKVDLAADIVDWEHLPFSGKFELQLTDSRVVRHFWEDWPVEGGTAQGQGSFSGSLDRPDLPLSATFLGARLYGVPLAKVDGRLHWTRNRLDLDLAADNGGEERLAYRGGFDLEHDAMFATEATATVSDIQPYLPKPLLGELPISGPFTGQATMSGPFTELSGKITASGDWQLDRRRLRQAEFTGSFAGRRWSIDRLAGRLDDRLDIDLSGRLDARSPKQGLLLDLDSLGLAYGAQHLALVAPGGLSLAADTLALRTPLTLRGELGRFRLDGRLGGAGQLTINAEAVHDTGLLRQWTGKDIGFGLMDFSLSLSGSPAAPDWHWQGRVEDLALGPAGVHLSGPFDLAHDAQGLAIRECSLSNGADAIHLAGRLPSGRDGYDQAAFMTGPLALSARLDLPHGGLLPSLFPQWLAASGPVHADLDLKGSLDVPRGQIRLSAAGLSPGPRLGGLVPEGDFTADGLLEISQDSLAIPHLELSSSKLNLQVAGSIQHLSLARLAGADWQAMPGQLSLSGRYSSPDLDWLARKAPRLRRAAGSAGGSFRLDGPLAHPQVRADLTLRNGALRGSDSLLVFRDISLDATLDQGQVTISSLSGSLGGALLQGSGRLSDVFGADPQLETHLTGTDLLLYRADGIKLRADADLRLTGTLKRPALSGDIRLTDSRINRRVDWLSVLKPGGRSGPEEGFALFSFKDEPFRSLQLDVRLKAARPLEIANNVYRGEVRPDLVLAGSGEVPYLRGLIYADSGRITLPAGRLELETGIIRFVEDDPDRPQLELQASGRMLGYDITAQVRGAYNEPEVTLSSSPAMASDDLLMLLLAGKRPVTAGQPTTSGYSTAAVYLSRGLLSRLFARDEGDPLLLDRLEVDVGRAVTPLGDPTVDARVKLAEGLGKRDVTLYLTGEKDTWDYYNAGLRVVFRFH